MNDGGEIVLWQRKAHVVRVLERKRELKSGERRCGVTGCWSSPFDMGPRGTGEAVAGR
jgi:hypothetical protein